MTVPVLSCADLPQRLVAAVPEFGPSLADHVAENDGEVLSHLLFWDLALFALDAHRRDDVDVTARVLGFLEQALAEGDDGVENLVVVSFVESLAADDGATSFVATWPDPLLRAAAGLA